MIASLEKWTRLKYENQTDVNDFLTEVKMLAKILNYTGDQTIKDTLLMSLSPRIEASRGELLDDSVKEAQRFVGITGVSTGIKEMAFVSKVSFRKSQIPKRDTSRSQSRGRDRDRKGRSTNQVREIRCRSASRDRNKDGQTSSRDKGRDIDRDRDR